MNLLGTHIYDVYGYCYSVYLGRVGEEMRAVAREREKAEGENAEARRKLEDDCFQK